jgi:hypothetical protein
MQPRSNFIRNKYRYSEWALKSSGMRPMSYLTLKMKALQSSEHQELLIQYSIPSWIFSNTAVWTQVSESQWQLKLHFLVSSAKMLCKPQLSKSILHLKFHKRNYGIFIGWCQFSLWTTYFHKCHMYYNTCLTDMLLQSLTHICTRMTLTRKMWCEFPYIITSWTIQEPSEKTTMQSLSNVYPRIILSYWPSCTLYLKCT